MNKLKKPFILLIAAIMLAGGSVTMMTASAAVSAPSKYSDLKERLSTVKSGKYGVGKYFTDNLKACPSHPAESNYVHDNCHTATAAEAGTAGCSQCFGFGRYVFYQLFGKSLSTTYWNARKYEFCDLSNITEIGQSTSATAAVWKSIISKAFLGDVIQASKTSTSGQHTMIVESVSSTGVKVLDCNSDGHCGVASRTLSWSYLTKYKYFTLYRSKNYPLPKLTVSHHANGGTLSSDTYKLTNGIIYKKSTDTKATYSWTYGTTRKNGLVNASTYGLKKTGYTFKGWSAKTSGSTVFDENDTALLPEEINSNLKNGDCSVTLYAIWNPNSYMVKYNANGGTGTVEASSHEYNQSKALSVNSFERFGYNFIGWSTDESASSPEYTDKQTVKNLSSVNKGTVTLYAVWKSAVEPITEISIGLKNIVAGRKYDINAEIAPYTEPKFIKWTLKDTENTGAVIDGDLLETSGHGKFTLTVTVKNGIAEENDFIKDFTVNVFKKGDVNADGSVDLRDLIRLKKYAANSIDAEDILLADIDGNNTINSLDIAEARKELLDCCTDSISASVPQD